MAFLFKFDASEKSYHILRSASESRFAVGAIPAQSYRHGRRSVEVPLGTCCEESSKISCALKTRS